jgi:hypothetical protein
MGFDNHIIDFLFVSGLALQRASEKAPDTGTRNSSKAYDPGAPMCWVNFWSNIAQAQENAGLSLFLQNFINRGNSLLFHNSCEILCKLDKMSQVRRAK